MSEVKRLEMDHKGLPFVDNNGVYVLYEDYAELKAQRDVLAAENGLAAKAVQTFCDVVGSNTDVIAEEMGMDGSKAILSAMSATGNMPATDAYLNSVRADAIANALDASSNHCDTDCVMDAYECSYEIAEMRSAGAIALHDGLVAYANELRAGKDGE